MIKHLLLLLSFFLCSFFSFSNDVYGSSMETATNSGFSNKTTNFNPGQTIYVKVEANNSGDTKHQLDLRDNEYNQISTYNLDRSEGNKFTTNFSAPTSEGYYSLEAEIQSGSSISTWVKTIKVGNSPNASVKVNIQNKVEGQRSFTVTNSSPAPRNPALSPKASSQLSPSPSPREVLSSEDVNIVPERRNPFFDLTSFFKKLWEAIWPFN